MMNECLKSDGGSPRRTSNFQPESQFGVNKNSPKNNLLNSMYHMQNASVADELGKCFTQSSAELLVQLILKSPRNSL